MGFRLMVQNSYRPKCIKNTACYNKQDTASTDNTHSWRIIETHKAWLRLIYRVICEEINI